MSTEQEMKEEIARLKAEVNALKLGSLLSAVDVLQFINLKAEVERLTKALKDEQAVAAHHADVIEKLRNAGDAMRWLIECQNDDAYYGHNEEQAEAVKAWNAAKEGKPSV